MPDRTAPGERENFEPDDELNSAVDPFWTEDDEDIEIEFRPISDEEFIEDVEAEEREKDQDL